MTRKSRPRRACAMCKWHKYIGNATQATKHSHRKQMARHTDPSPSR